MLRISPSPLIPYAPGGPLRFRRANDAVTGDSDEIDADEMADYLDGEIPGSVPLKPERQQHLVDFLI